MLDIVASFHGVQFQEKLMIQTQEKGEKSKGPNLGHKNFLMDRQTDKSVFIGRCPTNVEHSVSKTCLMMSYLHNDVISFSRYQARCVMKLFRQLMTS